MHLIRSEIKPVSASLSLKISPIALGIAPQFLDGKSRREQAKRMIQAAHMLLHLAGEVYPGDAA